MNTRIPQKGNLFKKVCFILGVWATLSLAGCGVKSESEGIPSAKEDSGYSFRFNDILLNINGPPKEVTDSLGEPLSYYEGASCVFDGMAKMYSYPDFEMEVYSENGSEIISAVILKDDLVSTEEGIFIGDSKERVVEIYGVSYEESTGVISYTKGETMLRFILRDDAVAAIEYRTTRG